jgi:tyrosine-protein kinase Etk/Wzc
MEQIALFDVLRRRAWTIVAVAIIATVAGYAFCLLLPNRYTASALVLVRPQQPINMGTTKDTKEFLDFPMGSASVIETASKTYIEIIKSPAVLGEVVRQLGLDKEKESGGGLLSKLPEILMYGSVIEDDPFAKAVKELSAGLKLGSLTDTYLFEISYPAKDPQRAADVTNTTAKTLIQFVNQLRVSEAKYQGDRLKAELEQRQQQLNAARERLESYKTAHSVFAYESEYDAKLKVISELEIELAKAEAALVGSQSTLSTGSPAAKRARLVRSIGELQAELASAPQIEREIKQLEEGVKVGLTAYEMVDKESKASDINLSYATPEARLVSEAVLPRVPSGPARATIALISLISGLIVGVGVAFILEYLNRGVRSIHDIEDFVGIRVIATIPRVLQRRWRHAGLL